MNNIMIYCQTENGLPCRTSLELLCEGRRLARKAGVKVEAMLIGHALGEATETLRQYGADTVYRIDDERLKEYATLPYKKCIVALLRKEEPSVVLFGATDTGRDLAPRVACAMQCGLTADCTSLDIDDFTAKDGTEYKNVLHQTRPAFLGNLLTTILSPRHMPQMATIRGGVFAAEPCEAKGFEVKDFDITGVLGEEDFCVKTLEATELESKTANLGSANVIVAGGYGMGSKENFDKLYTLAELLGGEVGATRAATDAGFAGHDRMIGQTGLTVHPKLYIACGISGQVQHTAGMDRSGVIVSINSDPHAPIHKIADYAIVADANKVVPKLIDIFSRHNA